jgi:hypothetical protein
MADSERRGRDRRSTGDRRHDRRAAADRRLTADDLPSRRMDVTRMEHENLCRQIDQLIRLLERIELGLHQQTQRIDQLDSDFRVLMRDRPA